MADAVLKRWRERCWKALESGDGLPRGRFGRAEPEKYSHGLAAAMQCTGDCLDVDDARTKLRSVAAKSAFNGWKLFAVGEMLALRWLREEMERNNG